MSKKERAGGSAVATIHLDVRFARAVGSNSRVERIFWNTLLPDLPQKARQRYLLEGPDRLRTDLGKLRHTDTGIESLDLRYRSFAKAVLNGGPVPELPYLPDAKDKRQLLINYPVLLADIASSAGMTPAVVPMNMHCWKIGHVQLAPEIADLTVGFVGKPGKCMKEITELASGQYPGGILVPCKGELSEHDLRFLRELGVAVFGLVEDCKMEGGMISVRAPRDWYLRLENQVSPEELKGARRPIGIVTWRPPPDDVAKTECEPTAARGPTEETEEVKSANAVPNVAGAPTVVAPDTYVLRANQVCGKLKVIEQGKSLTYDGVAYNIVGHKRWDLINELIAGDGESVKLSSENPSGVFSRDSNKFFKAAVKATGIGRRGDVKYKLLK